MSDSIFVMHFMGEKPTVGSMMSISEDDVHVTFLAHVLLDKYEHIALFTQNVNEVTKRTKPFALTVEGKSMFGIKEDIPVYKVKDTVVGDAKAFHYNLLAAAFKLGLNCAQPQFTGDNFVPHISVLGDSEPFTTGDEVTVTDVTVVRHLGGFGSGKAEVLANYKLEA